MLGFIETGEAARMSTTQTGLAGEFYVLAQIAQRGLIGTLTLGNTKSVDIVVYNPDTSRFWRVEVKASRGAPKIERLFGAEECYSWQMSEKHESIVHDDLLYIFVWLNDPSVLPKFFVVPSVAVAEYVAWEHNHWLHSPHKRPVKDMSLRRFRVPVSDPQRLSENWALFHAT
ncbi:MAG: hypothetical protein WC291_05320 [Thermodesulfovibrionales bacterium]|jgi:hypothetical protein